MGKEVMQWGQTSAKDNYFDLLNLSVEKKI